MPKPKQVTDDKLIMAVRKALKDIEPRKMPTEQRRNPYGCMCWVCPYCGQLCHKRGYSKYGSFNMHFGAVHGVPFWREQHIIDVVRKNIEK